ncbi:MAG TPA: hypothetical protein VLN61_13895 [Pseudolabrys sp.]|nr:hypothetical protein [Pseudolabrys sp.]
MDDDFRDEIAQLEARSEALTESIERCRKISLAAKLTIAAGVIWIVLVLLGVIAFSPGTIIAAMAAVIGGIVLLGSNETTWIQTDAALHEAEAMRADLIGRIDMRVVGDERPKLH